MVNVLMLQISQLIWWKLWLCTSDIAVY